MQNKKTYIKLSAVLITIFSLLFSPILASQSRADSLLVQNDGEVILLLDDGVLGTSVKANNNDPSPKKPESTPEKGQPSKPAPTKIVPLVPPNSATIVQAKPSSGNDKKINVTIQTVPITKISPSAQSVAPQTGAQNQPQTARSNQSPTPTPAPTHSPAQTLSPLQTNQGINASNENSIKKDVDRVILQNAQNQPIISLRATQPNQISVQQDKTDVETSLPLQINTQNHSISILTPAGPTKLNVLPQEALGRVEDQKLITSPIGNNQTENTKINLVQENGNILYKVKGQKQGKLFGIFTVKSPVEIKLSAQTGKITSTSQSDAFTLFKFLIR